MGEMAHYLVADIRPAYGMGPNYVKVLRCGPVGPTANDYDCLPTDVFGRVHRVVARNRDEALVAFGISKERAYQKGER